MVRRKTAIALLSLPIDDTNYSLDFLLATRPPLLATLSARLSRTRNVQDPGGAAESTSDTNLQRSKTPGASNGS